MGTKTINNTQATEIIITTLIIIFIIFQLSQQGLQISYESNINFFITESSMIILTLITIGLFEKTYFKEKTKFICSSLLLFIFALISFMILTYFKSQSSLIIIITGSVFLKIINSYKEFEKFKRNIFKNTTALVYSMLFTSLLSIFIYSFQEIYIKLIPLVWVSLYLIYIGYLLPFKYNNTSFSAPRGFE